MSDLKPCGIKVDIGGVEHEFLFTIEIIEAIQENCNAPLMELIGNISRVADGGNLANKFSLFCYTGSESFLYGYRRPLPKRGHKILCKRY